MFMHVSLRHIYLVFNLNFLYICYIDAEGCTAPNLLPDKPFVVVWNHPTVGCEKNGFNLGLDDWGIIDNPKDTFYGEDIVLFYDFGKFPLILGNGTAVNGGIPQLANMTWHLEKAEKNINTNIPSRVFSGLAVIDMESWRPCYFCNWGTFRKYQKMSLDLAKQRFPLFTPTQLQQEATKEFEDGAREVIHGGLLLARKLRPNGRWGHYGYPRCWDSTCNTTTYTINDKLDYIWNTSTGLFPSIYFKLDHPTKAQRELFIKQKIHETLRVKAKYAPHNATIFPYSKNQEGPIHLYTDEDLDDAIGEAANMGAAGVVLWGSSSSLRYHNECRILQHYIHDTLGPYVQNISNFFGNCSQQLCNNHGRCVRKDYERIFQHYLRESDRKSCLINEKNLVPNKSKNDLKENIVNQEETSKFSSSLHKRTNSLIFKPSISVLLWNWWDYNKLYTNKIEFFKRFKASGSVFNHNVHHFYDGTDGESVDDLKNSGYDFDDYVCKCFDTWSGIRCDTKDI